MFQYPLLGSIGCDTNDCVGGLITFNRFSILSSDRLVVTLVALPTLTKPDGGFSILSSDRLVVTLGKCVDCGG